jgi:hypothetical protein
MEFAASSQRAPGAFDATRFYYLSKRIRRGEMSECLFYIQALVDDVAVGFYVESSNHTEASNEGREAERRFPGKRIEIRGVEKLRSSNFV